MKGLSHMKLEDMTPELMEQAKQCETPEECMAFVP